MSDLFSLSQISSELQQIGPQLFNQNQSSLSIINNLLQIFTIHPQYFRHFTLQSIISVIDFFYLRHYRPANADNPYQMMSTSLIDQAGVNF